jgi:hypothetical protein
MVNTTIYLQFVELAEVELRLPDFFDLSVSINTKFVRSGRRGGRGELTRVGILHTC